MDISNRNFRMSGMRCKKHIIKATHQRDLAVQHAMPEQTEHFLWQLTFFQSVVVIQSRLRAPAKMNSGCYMTFAPLHDLRQFFPIIHFFKLHLFYRCSGNDHTVKFLFFHLFKAYIKLIQMASGSILCFMTRHRHKGHINLQRCVGQRSEQLKFCLFL